MRTIEERFWDKVEMIPFHSCWEWTGTKKSGYGVISAWPKEGNIYAHRVSLSLVSDLQAGKVIDHICRNRACVNPQHLRQVSIATNVMENSEGVCAKNAQKTHCLLGHEFTEENTYICPRGRRNCRSCRRIACAKARKKRKCTRSK